MIMIAVEKSLSLTCREIILTGTVLSHHTICQFEKTTGLPFGNEAFRRQSCLHIYRNLGSFPEHFSHKIQRHYLVGNLKRIPDGQEVYTSTGRKKNAQIILREKKFSENISRNNQYKLADLVAEKVHFFSHP